MYPYSLICHSLPHPPASPCPSLTHFLTPLPDSLSVSHILCLTHFSATSWLIHSRASFLSLSTPSLILCLTDYASLTLPLTPLPHELPIHSPASLNPHSVLASLLPLFISFLIHSASICLAHFLPHFFPSLAHSLLTPLPQSLTFFSLTPCLIHSPAFLLRHSQSLPYSIPTLLPASLNPYSFLWLIHLLCVSLPH